MCAPAIFKIVARKVYFMSPEECPSTDGLDFNVIGPIQMARNQCRIGQFLIKPSYKMQNLEKSNLINIANLNVDNLDFGWIDFSTGC